MSKDFDGCRGLSGAVKGCLELFRAVESNCGRSMAVKDYPELLLAVWDCRKLARAAKSCQFCLSRAAVDCQELLVAVKGCQRLLRAVKGC